MMSNPINFTLLLLTCLIFCGCIETQSSKSTEKPIVVSAVSDTDRDVISLFGVALPEKQLSNRVRKAREKELLAARVDYENDPDNLENIIWYGRRLAYLGEYHEAIRIYSLGLDKYPDSHRLLRHRGHRYITIRKFNEAIDDLQKAVFYARTEKNEIEPDGLPNRLNKPRSNTKFNIWYHLGIAYYLKGNFDKAISSFKKCQTFADNDDLRVAVTDWFYMTYRKTGNITAADELLQPIDRHMEIIENYAYHQRLLMYSGINDPETLLEKADKSDGSIDPTLGYGIGNWYLYSGKVDEAKLVYQRIILSPYWDAFGYVAAEADLQSLNGL